MPRIYVMTRADGKFYRLGADCIPVWAGADAVERSRAHCPELDLYRPTVVEGSVERRLEQTKAAIWLVDAYAPDSKLSSGRPITWKDLIEMRSEPEIARPAVRPLMRARVTELEFK